MPKVRISETIPSRKDACCQLERWWFIPDVGGNGCIMSVDSVGTYVNRLVVRAATFGDFLGSLPQITETVVRGDVTQMSFCQLLNGYSNASGTQRGLVALTSSCVEEAV